MTRNLREMWWVFRLALAVGLPVWACYFIGTLGRTR